MSIRATLERWNIDPYLIALVSMVALASVFPVRGQAAVDFSHATTIIIGLLFFLYGARLSREAIVQGLSHWRLHTVILASTFVLFPLLGLGFRVLTPDVLPVPLYMGLLLVCTLPSTVQSSIAFTSIAGGNVPAAVCAASASSLLGIFITPLLVALLMRAHGGMSFGAIEGIIEQLLLPFLAGQVARQWIGGFLSRHKGLTGLVDRGSILLIVYGAFSEGVVHGIWHQVDWQSLLAVGVANAALLALVLTITTFASRRLGFSRADEITIVFCGSKKSLAAGIPIVNVLFPANSVGVMLLPLILFHQIQLMVCATLARRYAAQAQDSSRRLADSGGVAVVR
ncbi:MAG TPA: bile acid:sodium symporter family protein [Rhodopila sp.]|uniref:bile acid:sodium symporter family protein n=1 Tax=Rhodopila sp. TaxID=2480087 RepID=UPI002B97374D|nr:bile acid:sodium symporter family protein [Rhodopila sp.]HVY16501.1 bile acid:sodium symporter family protein [Rhodopila sp.]